MITPKRIFGNQGEEAVVHWLVEHKFVILARNYQTRLGEVDIIATKDEVVSFIEVKTRKSIHFPILSTITVTKQKRVARAATSYILSNKIRNKVLRFDVAAVTTNAHGTYDISFIENAFTIPF